MSTCHNFLIGYTRNPGIILQSQKMKMFEGQGLPLEKFYSDRAKKEYQDLVAEHTGPEEEKPQRPPSIYTVRYCRTCCILR